MSRYLQVIPARPVNQAYTYENPFKEPCGLGQRVEIPWGPRNTSLKAAVIGTSAPKNLPIAQEKVKQIKRILDSQPLFDRETWELAKWLSSFYFCSLGEALFTILPGSLREKDSGDSLSAPASNTLDPTREQRRAIEKLRKPGSGLYYLHGVPGSGKTFVFLECAQHTLEAGKSVILLAPEITLAQQLIEAARHHLSYPVLPFHSLLSPSYRLFLWKKIVSEAPCVVVGVQSAVLTPVKNLGLIVVDEEQADSYKSGEAPRFHSRQVAMHRCKRAGAKLLLSSATPTLEAWRAMERGRITKLPLTKRLYQGPMNQIELATTHRNPAILSPILVQAIHEANQQGRQTMLFLNRRGFARFFHCYGCGYTLQCRHCSVFMTYHKNLTSLLCHQCGYKMSPPKICPSCHSLEMEYLGYGTQRVEEEVQRIFPEKKICRLDSDSIKNPRQIAAVIELFREGAIDILIGTQMIAKGLNFPLLGLVGVLCADVGLHIPDFRTTERLFSLVTQVSGRIGRFGVKGRVILQSVDPQAIPIQQAAKGEVESFYKETLEKRRRFDLPPFTRLFKLLFRGKNQKKVEQAADLAGQQLSQLVAPEELLGPVECPIERIAQNYRVQLILRSRHFTKLHKTLSHWHSNIHRRPPRGVYLEVDVDPLSML